MFIILCKAIILAMVLFFLALSYEILAEWKRDRAAGKAKSHDNLAILGLMTFCWGFAAALAYLGSVL